MANLWGSIYIHLREASVEFRQTPSIISVLPLPNLVFFPRTHVALHIPRPFFNRIWLPSRPAEFWLGIILKRVGEPNDSVQGQIGCVGRVTRWCEISCGRVVHLDLMGLGRFILREGWFDNGVGSARIDPIREGDQILHPERKRDLIRVLRVRGPLRNMAPETDQYLTEVMDDESFVNQMCLESGLSAEAKYFLLESGDLSQRAGRLADFLRLGSRTSRPHLDVFRGES